MSGFIRDPDFWYSFCLVAAILTAFFGIKQYFRKLVCRRCRAREAGRTLRRDTEAARADYPYETILTVAGMSCGSCARRVEAALNAFEGVSATANAGTETVTIFMRNRLSQKMLLCAVNRAGPFSIIRMEERKRRTDG